MANNSNYPSYISTLPDIKSKAEILPMPDNMGSDIGVIPLTNPNFSGVDQNYNTISSANLTPSQTIEFQQPQNVPIYPVSGLNANPPLQETAPEGQANDIISQLQGLNEQSIGESAFRAEQENAQGIPELQKAQSDLSSRLKTIQNEALAIPLQLQQEAIGRGVTAGGLQPIQTAALRNNAIQALSVSSLLEASRGNLSTAFDLADRAVAQKFDPIKEEIAVKTKNLDLILKSPAYSLAEKNRAQAQKDIQDAKAAQIAQQENNQKKIYDISVQAAQNGADTQTLQSLQNARTPQEALQIAGFYLGAEFRANIEERQFQRDLQEAQYNLSFDKFREDVRQYSEEKALDIQKQELLKQQAEIKSLEEQGKIDQAAQEKTEVLTSKINLINSLLGSSGLNSRVGPNRYTRIGVADVFGAGQEFAGGVHQLLQKETIDTLINLKARGGTLGALSDQERILLQEAASKIGNWEVKDKNNIGTGQYNITETAFKAELNRIKSLAQKALERATGSLSTSEMNTLNEAFGGTETSTINSFNPETYYGI